MTLRTLNYGNCGIFLIMSNAGFCPSTEGPLNLNNLVEVLRLLLEARAEVNSGDSSQRIPVRGSFKGPFREL